MRKNPHPSKYEEAKRQMKSKDYKVLKSLKALYMERRPEVEVEVIVVGGGKEKGTTIVYEAKKLSVSLLVLGQLKKTLLWRLWGGGKKRREGEVVEYCIQNLECMTLAMRKRSNRLGGYLITTKHHKNFWLLA
eukprot:Gb_16580 [translate_table: standard]